MKKVFKVFATELQRKKHISQMSAAEVAYLNRKIDAVEHLIPSFHLKNREDVRDIPLRKYWSILNNPERRNIIEYNETVKDGKLSKRVLIRDSEAVTTDFKQAHEYNARGKAVLCFVLEYETGTIITAYYNYEKDAHYTLDMGRYDASICIYQEKRTLVK